MRRQTLDAPEGSLSALRWGEGDPQLLLVHGAGLQAGTFTRLLLALGVDAISVDLPGHGRSARLSAEDYRIEVMGDMVAAGLTSAGLRPRRVIGHSLGSFVSARAASSLGGLDELIVLDATPHRVGTADPTRIHSGSLDDLVTAMCERMPHRSRPSLERAVLRSTRVREDGLREWMWDAAFMDAVPLRALERENIWHSFRTAAAKTVLVRGERGGVSNEEAAEFAARVTGAAVVVAPQAGHNVHTDQPGWLASWFHATAGQ